MKILCDTSYFLPLIKLKMEKIPSDLLLTLLKRKDNEIYYSELSLFEIAAKGYKIILSNPEITFNDILYGIDSIQNDSRLNSLTWLRNPLIMELALNIRKIHKDTLDCFIFATAICYCDCITTLDHTIYDNIMKNKEIVEDIARINQDFSFWFDDLSKEPVSVIN